MTPERRAEIEAALAAATPVPWSVGQHIPDRVVGAKPRDVFVADTWRGEGNRQARDNALLIANAPTYLRELLDALADAWDEGEAGGRSRAMRLMSDEPTVERAANPYRSQP